MNLGLEQCLRRDYRNQKERGGFCSLLTTRAVSHPLLERWGWAVVNAFLALSGLQHVVMRFSY